jgi:hypothetical protein
LAGDLGFGAGRGNERESLIVGRPALGSRIARRAETVTAGWAAANLVLQLFGHGEHSSATWILA